ncbi:MAG: membrane protease YdiL (CAAX protease family) [Planctomycetota bacterium]|jgi:membrane protease YdiL (CAAX protease family)
MDQSTQAPSFDLRAASAPFGWLVLCLTCAMGFAFAMQMLVPAFSPSGGELSGLNPLHSVVKLEVPSEQVAQWKEFAADLVAQDPERFVELDSSGEVTLLVVVANVGAPGLASEIKGLAYERGLTVGSFHMGSNLGRLSARLLESPEEFLQMAEVVLPLTLFSSGGVLLLFGFLLRRRLRLPATKNAPSISLGRRVGTGVVVGLVLVLMVEGIGQLVARMGYPITEQPWLGKAFEAGGLRWYAVVFAVTVLAPVGEELFFRGYLLPALTRQLGVAVGVLLSSLAFAGIHGHLPAMPAYLVYGVGLALIARKSDSLLVPSVAHMTANSLAVLVLILSGS